MLCSQSQARRVFAHALENRYAILAVNADSHACISDCLEAARECDAPIIIQTSLWQLEGHSFGIKDAVLGLARYIVDVAALADAPQYRGLPVVVHTDHIKGPKTFDILAAGVRGIDCAIAGQQVKLHPSTVSLDASEFTDDENIEAISRLAQVAKDGGVDVTLEMESSVDAGITPAETTRKLIGSVEARHAGVVHLYAPGLGTKHGFSEDGYPEFSVKAVADNIKLLRSITGRNIGLALHGSSGLSKDDLAAAAREGVVKVNWSTESLMLRSAAAMAYYRENAEKLDRAHREWKGAARWG